MSEFWFLWALLMGIGSGTLFGMFLYEWLLGDDFFRKED